MLNWSLNDSIFDLFKFFDYLFLINLPFELGIFFSKLFILLIQSICDLLKRWLLYLLFHGLFNFLKFLFCLRFWICFNTVAMNLMQEGLATTGKNCHKVTILARIRPFSDFSFYCIELVKALRFVKFIEKNAQRFFKMHSMARSQCYMKEFFFRVVS